MSTITDLAAQLRQPVTADNEAELEAAAVALGEKGERALPIIKALLQAPEADLRFWAVRSLWANGSPAAVELLIAQLTDTEDMLRSGVAFALGELRSTKAIPTLTQLLHHDFGSPGDHAADALSKIGQPAADALIAGLPAEAGLVRLRAVKALIPIECRDAIRPLIHCLNHDPGYLVRHYADVALKRMGVGEMVYFR